MGLHTFSDTLKFLLLSDGMRLSDVDGIPYNSVTSTDNEQYGKQWLHNNSVNDFGVKRKDVNGRENIHEEDDKGAVHNDDDDGGAVIYDNVG